MFQFFSLILAFSVPQVFGMEELIDVTIDGEYYWELLWNIDNTNNSGKITREVTVTTEISISYDNMVRSLSSASLGGKYSSSLSGKLNEVVEVGVQSELSWEVKTEYEKLSKTNREYKNSMSRKDYYEVGANSRLILYQLVFRGPGVSYLTDTISSDPAARPVVPIHFRVRQIYVLQDIKVFYTDDSVSRPSNLIDEKQGKEPNINDGLGGKFVWLVPVWSLNADDGATGIQIANQKSSNSHYHDLGGGVGWGFRYIKMLKDPKSRLRITAISLWKGSDKYDTPTTNGFFQFMTDNINEGRGGGYPLRLAWNATLAP